MPAIRFTASLLKFADKGEKTGWTYIEVPTELAEQLMLGNKKSFRVKGYLDKYAFEKIALMPMGKGNFIMAVNAVMRKAIRKASGAMVQVKMQPDENPVAPPAELIECLKDEPAALEGYNKLSKSFQNYFTKWIESAKTDITKAKRIDKAVTALSMGQSFGEMIRSMKDDRTKLLG